SELQFDFTYLPPRWGIDPGIILPGRTKTAASVFGAVAGEVEAFNRIELS
nr:hypothetical protein [Tanacetum cinerariifolium]